MVYLDIHLEVFIQTMSFEEANYSFCVYIILMLSRLHWFRLDEECACETFAASIVASQCKHSCEMLLFTLLVCVEQAHIAFASTPEYIVATAKLNGCINSIFNLNSSTSNNIEIRICGSTIHIAFMTKHVGCTPKQMLVRMLCKLLFQIVCDSLHALLIFFNSLALFDKVYIMEAEILNTELLHYLESGIHLVLGTLQG